MCAMRGSRCSCVKPTEPPADRAQWIGGAFSFHHRVPWARTTLHPAAWTVEKPTQPSDQSGCARGVTLETIVRTATGLSHRHVSPFGGGIPAMKPSRARSRCVLSVASLALSAAVLPEAVPLGA